MHQGTTTPVTVLTTRPWTTCFSRTRILQGCWKRTCTRCLRGNIPSRGTGTSESPGTSRSGTSGRRTHRGGRHPTIMHPRGRAGTSVGATRRRVRSRFPEDTREESRVMQTREDSRVMQNPTRWFAPRAGSYTRDRENIVSSWSTDTRMSTRNPNRSGSLKCTRHSSRSTRASTRSLTDWLW